MPAKTVVNAQPTRRVVTRRAADLGSATVVPESVMAGMLDGIHGYGIGI